MKLFILYLLIASLLGCTFELVVQKPVGGCSDVTMKSIDDALVSIADSCKAKESKL